MTPRDLSQWHLSLESPGNLGDLLINVGNGDAEWADASMFPEVGPQGPPGPTGPQGPATQVTLVSVGGFNSLVVDEMGPDLKVKSFGEHLKMPLEYKFTQQ